MDGELNSRDGGAAAGPVRVSAVVTSHNSGPRLIETLDALAAEGACAEIHLVDSGSTDGSVDLAEQRFPALKITRLGSNRGPCATRNAGVAAAACPWVLLLDDDTVPAPGCVETLASELRSHPDAAMAGPRIVHGEDPGRIQYEGGVWHFAGLPHMEHMDEPCAVRPPRDVDVLTAGCVLVRRDAVQAAGGFDEGLFFLMEDVELSVRLRLAGWRLRVHPGAVAVNRGGSEGLSLKERHAYPKRRVFFHSRNRCLLLLSLYRLRTLFLLTPALLVMEAAWFLFSLREGAALSYIAGKADVLRRLRGAFDRQRSLQRSRGPDDRILLRAPPLTLTRAALRRPLARSLARVLDFTLAAATHPVRGVVP